MDNAENLFNPSLAAALMKLDPEDGEQIMEYIKTHALLTREKALLQASVREQKKLLVENAKLKKDIEQLRIQLQEKQRRRTAPPPRSLSSDPCTPVDPPASPVGATASVPTKTLPPSSSSHERRDGQNRRSRGGRKARPTSVSLPLGLDPRVDVSRLDLRIGRILSGRHHPLAERMSVLEVDVGENSPRTVVSKLGEITKLEELQGCLTVLLCNVKACKLKGVVSQARVLCCSTSDDSIELLAPPSGSTPGDRVTFLNFPGDPDRELQAKQRIWELLQPDLQVDCRGVATYKGCGFEVKGKGLCRAPSLTNCIIR
ncbi:aminoacyl tRNA synthase complex-interacting multifunctional protein 1b isoform X2 [Anabas testudineus]|uniref:aminoacyl tRNA synthase complex-interacting multifunctional protein 1b isoform X2 n=1 Tax=Anabas testudineus TaxID=64144 RepID=UPI000E46410E|nr:aminoacyl tRNA synthase complex-interacting multifunctional protein 1b isoform X2 [Anabas testudineus]